MNWLLVIILAGMSLYLVGMGLGGKGKIYEFPFFAGATFLGFVLPQLPALANDPFLPDGAFETTLLFTILCAASVGWGWKIGNRPLRSLRWRFDEGRLLWVAAALSLVGAYFYYKLSRLPKEVLDSSQWTGLPIMYLFFGTLLTYGFVIAVMSYMRSASKVSLFIALFGSLLILDRIVIAGRRGEIAQFILSIGLAAWFYRGVALPRAIALVLALAAGLALNSASDYRSITMGDTNNKLSKLTDINIIRNFEEEWKYGGPEMRNALLRIYWADQSKIFDYGLFHWNTLVFNFVPAQIVGAELKQSLTIKIPGSEGPDYHPPTGSTETGMADAFASFWFFGAIKFFVLGYALGRLYRSAMAGSEVARLLYILSVVPGMLCITHHTQWIVSSWVNIALMLLPWLALARAKASHQLSAAPSPPSASYIGSRQVNPS